MRLTYISRTLCVSGLSVLALAAAPCAAMAGDDMSFAGKTVTMTIGQSAGGGTDLYGRLLGRIVTSHLPGTPNLVVINQPGAGGIVSLNSWVKKAKPDGLSVTIGAQSQTDPAALLRTHAKYDPTTFKYVGGLAAPSQALFIRKDALARLHDKSAKPVVMGAVGSTLRSGYYQAMWGAAFLGWNIKWVHGYRKTSGVRQALEQGEVEMTSFGSVRDIGYLLKSGKVTVIAQSGTVIDGRPTRRGIVENAPVIADLVKGKIKGDLAERAFAYAENVSQVGRWLALPPGTPNSIVAVYVKAFDDALKDPQYRKAIKKVDPDSPVATKKDLEELVHKLSQVSPDVMDYIQGQLKRQGFTAHK